MGVPNETVLRLGVGGVGRGPRVLRGVTGLGDGGEEGLPRPDFGLLQSRLPFLLQAVQGPEVLGALELLRGPSGSQKPPHLPTTAKGENSIYDTNHDKIYLIRKTDILPTPRGVVT